MSIQSITKNIQKSFNTMFIHFIQQNDDAANTAEDLIDQWKQEDHQTELQNQINELIAASISESLTSRRIPKPKKDPDAPRKPGNAYVLFCADRRPKLNEKEIRAIMKSRTNKKGGKLLRPQACSILLGEEWRKASKSVKDSYQKKFLEEQAVYAEKKKNYVQPDEYKNAEDDYNRAKALTRGKGKSRGKPKDPDAPKRPLSAYFHFLHDYRVEHTSDWDDLSEQEQKDTDKNKNTWVVSRAGEVWRLLTPKKKTKWNKLAQKDRQRYEKEMENYQPSPEFQKALEQWKELNPTKATAKAAKPKEPKPRKRAPTAWQLFSKETRPKLKEQFPSLSGTDISAKLSDMWKQFKQTDKGKQFIEECAKLKKEF